MSSSSSLCTLIRRLSSSTLTTTSSSLVCRYSPPVTFVRHAHQISSYHQRRQQRRQEEEEDDDKRRRWRTILGSTSGFSLGLLGFFESKDKELSPEDELLLELKRAVLAMMVKDSTGLSLLTNFFELFVIRKEGEEEVKVEKHLHKAWTMSVELNREDVKTQIIDMRANFALQVGHLERALELFKLVIQRLVFHQGVNPQDNSIVEMSVKMAQIYNLRGQVEEAKSGLEYCVDVQRKKIHSEESEKDEDPEDTLMLLAWSLHNLAQIYMTEATQSSTTTPDPDTIRKATEAARESRLWVEKAVGPEAEQAIAIRSDLAAILALEGNVDAALTELEECQRLAGVKYPFLQATIKVNIGGLRLQNNEASEAGRICQEAKLVAEMFNDRETVLRAEDCIKNATAAAKAAK